MYTYDEVIANGYLVFGANLSCEIISDFYLVLCVLGKKSERKHMTMDKLRDIVEFKDLKYVLKEGKTEVALYPYMNPDVIMIFKLIQQTKEEYQEVKDSYQEKKSSKQYIKK